MNLTLKDILWIAMVLAFILFLAGCSTLNEYGIGGEPLLMCKYRDGAAYIDDKLVGSDNVHAGVNRRFRDGDALCMQVMQ